MSKFEVQATMWSAEFGKQVKVLITNAQLFAKLMKQSFSLVLKLLNIKGKDVENEKR